MACARVFITKGCMRARMWDPACKTVNMSYVLGIDVGTTRVRCFAVDKDGQILSSDFTSLQVLHPQQGHSEIDPEGLWQDFKKVVINTLSSGQLDPSEAVCMGITCLRNTFLLWNRTTGVPLCNLITWQDRRAAGVCKEWNESMQFKFLNAGAGMLHFFTRSKRFLAASIITLTTQQVAPRLYWALNNIEGAKALMAKDELCFGTVDSWILWKLTNGKVHATDYSNVCTTVLYDPYQLKYSDTILNVMGFSKSMLPEVKDSGGDFGTVEESHFGAPIPITGIISDQTSATFAQGCWNPGDLKCTLGTGMFLTINTGKKPHASLSGYYPVIGWKIGEDLTYLAEANFPSCGSVVEWGKNFGFYSDPIETEAIALSVSDSDGACFVPSFDGIQVPYNDPRSAAGIIGLTHNTRKEHIVRSILESLAYTFKQVYDVGVTEIKLKIGRLCVDGGVSKNNFVMQLSSELLGQELQRPRDVDMTVYGAIYVAGLASGFWKNKDEIRNFWQLDRKFLPTPKSDSEERKMMLHYNAWQQAVQRSLDWYKKDKVNA